MNRYRIATYLAIFTAVVTYVLITWGGLVFNTGSSMACPDWPLCFGMVFPEMKGGVFFEHTHRILGTLVGFCCLGLFALLWSPVAGFRSARALGIGLVLLVIFQGVLGGFIVMLNLPPLVRMAHLGTSLIFFMTIIHASRAMWLRSRGVGSTLNNASEFLRAPSAIPNASSMAALLAIVCIIVYLQILFGALVRHTGATYALHLGWSGSFVPVDAATLKPELWPSERPAAANALHRYLAPPIAMLVAFACARCFLAARAAGRRGLALLAWGPLLLVLLQILMGIVMLGTVLNVAARTGHLAVATLLLANLFLLWLIFRGHSVSATSGAGVVLSPRPRDLAGAAQATPSAR